MGDLSEERERFFDELYALDNEDVGDNLGNGDRNQTEGLGKWRRTVPSDNSDSSTLSPSSPLLLARPLPKRPCPSTLTKNEPAMNGGTEKAPILLDHENSDDDLSKSVNLRQSVNRTKRSRMSPSSQGEIMKPSSPHTTRPQAEAPPRGELRTASVTNAEMSNKSIEVEASQAIHPEPRCQRPKSSSASRGKDTRKGKASDKVPPEKPVKRQRKDDLPEIPKVQRILQGMVFYFIPNNDINPARRFRIKKSEQYGAIRATNFDDKVTHVIVDRELKWKDVLRHFNADEVPSGPAYVDENYPAECIGFRMRADVECSRFQIDGREKTVGQHALKDSNSERDSMDRCAPQQTPKDLVQPTPPDVKEATPQSQSAVAVQSNHGSGNLRASRAYMQPTEEAYNDELSEVIGDMKGTEDLVSIFSESDCSFTQWNQPLDVDEDSKSYSSSPSFETSADSDIPQLPVNKTQKSKVADDFSTFSCMRKSDARGVENNPNARTMEILQQMATYYDKVGDTWRTRAYRRAISELRRQPKKIMTKEDAIQLPGIGPRLADKIEEIVWTDRLKRLESTSHDPHMELLSLFTGIYGAGYAQASRWIAQGYHNLDDLRSKADLTANQRIGIEHYDDFQQRIPREEVERHASIVRKEIHKQDSTVEVIIGGSYRRGSNSSGDIDLLITKEGASAAEIKSILDLVVDRLCSSAFLVAALSTSHKESGSKWHGASCLPESKIWRRIDLLYVPGDELGAALIYFTGNDIFNRSIRLLASHKGMRLNQHGLYKDVLRGPQRTKVTTGTLLEGRDEKKIFQILGVPYRPPWHRIC